MAKIMYTATYGEIARTRTSAKAYTHASVVRLRDGEIVILSFHTSEALAAKSILTADQKERGAAVIAVVPVTAG